MTAHWNISHFPTITAKSCLVSSLVARMDSTKEPFTRRMIRRAILKREQEASPNFSSDALRRKKSILQAINDSPNRKTSFSDYQTDKHAAPTVLSQDNHDYFKDSSSLTEAQNYKENHKPHNNIRKQYITSFLTKPSASSSLHSSDVETDSTIDVLTHYSQKKSHVRGSGLATEDLENHKTQCYPSERAMPLDYIRTNMTLKPPAAQNNTSIWKTNEQQFAKNSEISDNRNDNSDFSKNNDCLRVKDTNNNRSQPTDEFQTLNSSILTQHAANDLMHLTRSSEKTSSIMFQGRTENSTSSSSYIKGFELGNVVWRGPLYNAARASSRRKNHDVQPNLRSFESQLHDVTVPELLKVQHTEIKVPQKMRAELHTVDRVPEVVADFKSGSSASTTNPQIEVTNCSRSKLFLPLNAQHSRDLQGEANTESTGKFYNQLTVQNDSNRNANSPTTPLSAAIRDLDAEIQRLEFRPSFFTPDNKTCSTPDRILQRLKEDDFPVTEYPTGKNIDQAWDIRESGSGTRGNLPREEIRTDFQKNVTFSCDGRRDFETNSSITGNSELDDKDIASVEEGYLSSGLENIPKDIETIFQEQISSEEAQFDKNVDFNMENELNSEPESRTTSSAALTFEKKRKKSKNNPFAKVFSFMMPLKSEKHKLKTPNLDATKQSKSSSNPQGDSTSSSEPGKLEDLENTRSPQDDRTTNAVTRIEVRKYSDGSLGDQTQITATSMGDNGDKLIVEDGTLHERKMSKITEQTMTELPAELTKTSDKSMMMYKSLSPKMRKTFSPELKLDPKVPSSSSYPEDTSKDVRKRHLLHEINVQQTLIHQASKALNLCNSMREFMSSPELVESERLLLIAGYRKNALLQAMQEGSISKADSEESLDEEGQVTLKDFSLALKEDVLKEEGKSGDYVQWFVIVVTHGLTVWATHAISCPVKSPTIHFPGCITLPNLTRNFRITVRVYSLKLRRVTYNYEEKYHLNRDEKHTRCPSPRNFLRRMERPVTTNEVSAEMKTSFSLSGIVELQLQDLGLTAPWPLMSVPTGSVLRGIIDLTLSSKLHLSLSHVGFLTHCDEAGGFAVWNRRWCLLQGHTLVFWNYPRDQENKAPLLTIDLTNCASDEVTTVDRSLCAKPRTFLIETARRRSANDRDSMIVQCRPACTIVRNLLSCDTSQDFTEWTSKLNRVISALRDWNVMTRRPQPQITDL